MEAKDYLLYGFIIVCVIAVAIFVFENFYGNDVSKEGFRARSQNYVMNNRFDNANRLGYGSKRKAGLYSEKSPSVVGPSSPGGINKNSDVDVYDNRGFKWTVNGTNPQVDAFVDNATDAQLRNRFEREYLLDPDGSVAKYDLTNNKSSVSCCPAQWSPSFKVTGEDNNCAYSNKYVANNYSSMSADDNAACTCVTPQQAAFFGTRGGNSSYN
jgi:hypothetical protein